MSNNSSSFYQETPHGLAVVSIYIPVVSCHTVYFWAKSTSLCGLRVVFFYDSFETCVIYIYESYFVKKFLHLQSSRQLMKDNGVFFVRA